METVFRQGAPIDSDNHLIPGLSLIMNSIEYDSLHPSESTELLDYTE